MSYHLSPRRAKNTCKDTRRMFGVCKPLCDAVDFDIGDSVVLWELDRINYKLGVGNCAISEACHWGRMRSRMAISVGLRTNFKSLAIHVFCFSFYFNFFSLMGEVLCVQHGGGIADCGVWVWGSMWGEFAVVMEMEAEHEIERNVSSPLRIIRVLQIWEAETNCWRHYFLSTD